MSAVFDLGVQACRLFVFRTIGSARVQAHGPQNHVRLPSFFRFAFECTFVLVLSCVVFGGEGFPVGFT